MDKDLFLKLHSMVSQSERARLFNSEIVRALTNEEVEKIIGDGNKKSAELKLEALVSKELATVTEEERMAIQRSFINAHSGEQAVEACSVLEKFNGGTLPNKEHQIYSFAQMVAGADEIYQSETASWILCCSDLSQTIYVLPFVRLALSTITEEEANDLIDKIERIESSYNESKLTDQYQQLLDSYGETTQEEVLFYNLFEEDPKLALKLLDYQYGNIDLTPETRVRVKRRKPKNQKIES